MIDTKSNKLCILIIICLIMSGCSSVKKGISKSSTPPSSSITSNQVNSPIHYINDFNGKDLTSFDFTNTNLDNLVNADFDTKTIWPKKLPKGFNPEAILESNKNPGLGILKLHDNGINGKGVNLAIIDYKLLTGHSEYKDKLKMYEEINSYFSVPHSHGSAITSIAAGKTTGVATEAGIYYIGSMNIGAGSSEAKVDYSSYVKAIERLIEVNKALPKNQKIRVLSISAGWAPSVIGYSEMMESVKKAEENGIFVVSLNLFETNNFYFHGLDVSSTADRDNFDSYNVTPWSKWIYEVKAGKFDGLPTTMIKCLIPIHLRRCC